MRIIVELDVLKNSLPIPETLSGSELTVLYRDGSKDISIDLFNELVARKIKVSFEKAEYVGPFSFGFYLGLKAASLSGDIVFVCDDDELAGEAANCLAGVELKGNIAFSSDFKSAAKLLSGKSGKKTRSGAKRKPAKAPADDKAQDSQGEVSYEPFAEELKELEKKEKPTHRTSQKQKKAESAFSMKFLDVLEQTGVNSDIRAAGRDFGEVHEIIREAVAKSEEPIGFEVQLQIRVQNQELSKALYAKLKDHFDDLKRTI